MSSFSEDLNQWRERITSVQRTRQSPEAIAAAELRAESKSRTKKHATKAKRLRTVQAFTKCSNAGNLASLRGASRNQSAMSEQQPQQVALNSVFGAAASEQTIEEANERVELASKAMLSLKCAVDIEDEEEADEMIENARFQLEQAGHAWTAKGIEGANDVADLLGDGESDDDSNDDGENDEKGRRNNNNPLNDLLSDLKSEPENDNDCATRFKLYEEHTETVATVRKSLFEFWRNAQEDVPMGAAKESIEASLENIDHTDNLEVDLNPKYWFVYSMAKKVTSNESKIGLVLREIQTKLELLASTEDCPICLESIENHEDEHVFGCAHKVHKECWAHWSAHCTNNHKAPFCPLCRNDEFLEDILS